jgi:hypothetical protein
MQMKDIGFNALEDSTEDAFSMLLNEKIRHFAKPFIDKYQGDTITDEFMRNFINTFIMGCIIYGMTKFNIIFERIAKVVFAQYTYIIFGNIKGKILERLKNSNLKGKRGFKILESVLGADKTQDRIGMMSLVNDNINAYDKNKLHYENQYALNNSNVDSFTAQMASHKAISESKAVTLFTDLSFRGAWQNTAEHKRIYEKATGVKVVQTGQGSWSTLYAKLNEFTQFHKTIDGLIVSQATLMAKNLNANGAKL